jgi:AraC family ethanolamine operon transcriptional activator
MVRKAQDFIEANLHRPLTLKDISQAVFTSRRSLIYGFQDMFGMGPMSYLKIQRLNGVRRALLLADPKFNQVKEIAYDWGFWHLGHFCQDYKNMFRETPSQTLKEQY